MGRFLRHLIRERFADRDRCNHPNLHFLCLPTRYEESFATTPSQHPPVYSSIFYKVGVTFSELNLFSLYADKVLPRFGVATTFKKKISPLASVQHNIQSQHQGYLNRTCKFQKPSFIMFPRQGAVVRPILNESNMLGNLHEFTTSSQCWHPR